MMQSDEKDGGDDIGKRELTGAAADSTKGINHPRPSRSEMQLRAAAVADLIIQNFKRYEIIELLQSPAGKARYGELSIRAIDRLIHNANLLIEDAAVWDIQKEKNKAKARFEDLYKRSVSKGQFGTASRIQARINKLIGLDAPTKLGFGADPNAPPLPAGISTVLVVVQEAVE